MLARSVTLSCPAFPAPTDERRRIGQTRLGALEIGRFPASQWAVLAAQFPKPTITGAPDYYGLNAQGFNVPPNEAGTGAGDSGGTLFLVRPNGTLGYGWRARNGRCLKPHLRAQSDTAPSRDGRRSRFCMLAWLDQVNPLRQVTAATGNFSWSNQAAWVDDVLGKIGEVPN